MYSILCDVFSINSDLHVVVKYRDTMHTNALLGALVNVYTNWTLFVIKKKLLYTRETVLNAWLTLLSPTLANRSNIYHDNYDYKCIFWVFYVSNNNQQNHIRQNCEDQKKMPKSVLHTPTPLKKKHGYAKFTEIGF